MVGLALAVELGPSWADDRKPDTPERAYDIRVTCAGAAAAAVAEADMAGPGTDKQQSDARKLMAITRDEALGAGGRVGLSAAQVSDAIDQSREDIVKRFARVAGDPVATAKQKADLGRVVIDCALVEAVERQDPARAPKAEEHQPPQ